MVTHCCFNVAPRLQRFPNIKSALGQHLLETHSFQGPDISFVLPIRRTSDRLCSKPFIHLSLIMTRDCFMNCRRPNDKNITNTINKIMPMRQALLFKYKC